VRILSSSKAHLALEGEVASAAAGEGSNAEQHAALKETLTLPLSLEGEGTTIRV